MPNVTQDFERDNVLRKDNISYYNFFSSNQVKIHENMEFLFYYMQLTYNGSEGMIPAVDTLLNLNLKTGSQ